MNVTPNQELANHLANRYGIRLMLDLSTAHLPRDPDDPEVAVNPNCYEGITAYRMKYGYLMWVPDDPNESADMMDEEVPAALLNIQLYARARGCDYVLFDEDADRVDDLPRFDRVARREASS